MIENIENCKNCMIKMPQKIDLHQCKDLLEIFFGWRDITQNKLLKYGGGKFSPFEVLTFPASVAPAFERAWRSRVFTFVHLQKQNDTCTGYRLVPPRMYALQFYLWLRQNRWNF